MKEYRMMESLELKVTRFSWWMGNIEIVWSDLTLGLDWLQILDLQ